MEDLVAPFLTVPLTTTFFVVAMGSARALGALFGLWGLYFVLGPAALLRSTLALIISAPVIMVQIDSFVALTTDTQSFALMLIPLREFGIGFALGLLMSLPFFSILGAAMLIDQYLGNFSPGIQAPEGQTVGPYANLNVIIALFLFVEAGGFLVMVSVLYESFGVFAPAVPGLSLVPGFGDAMGDILQNIMLALVVFALPVILILMLLEFGINIISRMSEQIKMPSIDFLAKNLILVLMLPLLTIGLFRMIGAAIDGSPAPLQLAMRLMGL